jgi:hypothetical protein
LVLGFSPLEWVVELEMLPVQLLVVVAVLTTITFKECGEALLPLLAQEIQQGLYLGVAAVVGQLHFLIKVLLLVEMAVPLELMPLLQEEAVVVVELERLEEVVALDMSDLYIGVQTNGNFRSLS